MAAFCDTRVFRRLDGIRQLGGCSFVYPSATHTRLEHSIGVCHLAAEVGRHLQRRYPGLVDEDDVLCLQLAGLAHDLGHGPFSHTFETCFPQWCHETEGERLLRGVVASGEFSLRGAFEEGTEEQHLAFVCLLIRGLGPDEAWPGVHAVGRTHEKRFLVDIVHSRTSGLDVDKLDYLARDSQAVFGAMRPLNLTRLVHATRLASADDHDSTAVHSLAFDESVECEIAEVFTLRARLHRQVYQHHAVLVVESKLVDLMRRVVSCDHDILSLTDAFVLTQCAAHDPGAYHALHAKALFAPSSVRLPTLPLCVGCKRETEFAHAFCPFCGRSTADRVQGPCRDGEGGHAVPSISADELTRRVRASTGDDDVRVYVSDVTCGNPVVVVDPHGKAWRDYDPLRQRVVSGDLVRESPCVVPSSARHVRTARCHVGRDAVDERTMCRLRDALLHAVVAE